MNYATIKKCDVANGPGIRVSLFVSGCEHRCPGCFNSEAWDFSYGEPYTEDTERQIIELLEPSHIEGLTLLGGEPMHPKNRATLLGLLKKVRAAYPEKEIWCYTGYTIDELKAENDATVNEMLKLIDVLVEGRFLEALKSPRLRFKGSANQRIIMVKETLSNNEVVLWEGDRHQEVCFLCKQSEW